ncbi:neuronal acetylcholine receptor subunit alpha-3-like isoform X2 [Apostichopus japonicus]
MLELSWEDYRLQWNPSDHKGINETKIHLRRSDVFTIWTPELVLNQSYQTDFASFQPESYVARLDYTGLLRWYTLAVTTSLCRMDLLYFPLDKQTCWLTFTTWEYQTTEQVFYLIDDLFNNETYLHYIVDQSLWDVKVLDRDAGNVSYDCDICAGEEQSHVTYVIELKRRHPMLYFFSLILPCFILSIMTSAVPFLDKVKDADPSTFGLTNMLTLMVFLTYLFSTLPSSSQTLFGFYIIIALAEGTVTTLGTIFWLRFQSVSKNNVASKMAPQKKHNPNLVSKQPVATSQDPGVGQVKDESHKGDEENGPVQEEEETQTKSKTEDDGQVKDESHKGDEENGPVKEEEETQTKSKTEDDGQVKDESHKGDEENGPVKEEKETQTMSKTEDDACGDKPDQKHLTWWKCVLLVILIKFTSTAYLIIICLVAAKNSHDIS